MKELPHGEIELTFSATSQLETIAWVLSFGGEVELLEPKEIRDELAVRSQKMLESHEKELGGNSGKRGKAPVAKARSTTKM